MVTEPLELKRHIIDSLILPKVLDEILEREGRFEILEMAVGERPADMSRVRLRVEAAAPEALAAILSRLREQGAETLAAGEAALAPAPADGVFPDGFYVSTNFPTSLRVSDRWVEVQPVRMDCGVVYDAAAGTARTVKFAQVRRGDPVVVGHAGVRVEALSAARGDEALEFMASSVSSEKPKSAMIRRVVDFLLAGSIRDDGPLPEVVTDVLQAQLLMAEKVQGCEMALMIATMLHSVATGNLLPATCRTVCVDINPAVVTKLADRGTHQAVGLVTDVEPFFAELLGYLGE